MILVIGSINTDMVIKTVKFPEPGETVLGSSFYMNSGGKGANQAITAARLGGNVAFISRTGNDIFGIQAISSFESEGIDVSHIVRDKNNPSGVALITVDQKGENSIVVAPGANGCLTIDDIEKAIDLINQCEFILIQLEIPMEVVEFVCELSKKFNKKLVMNPAPAQTLPNHLFPNIYLITPNKSETNILTGINVVDFETAKMASKLFFEKGVKNVIITLGSEGCAVFDGVGEYMIDAENVEVVDTTAAGDSFNGALVFALSLGKPVKESAKFANKVAAITVTKLGAQPSIPYLNQVIS